MWKAIKECYGESARFAVALPLLVAVPIVAELIQHVIEFRVGMFDSYASAEATGEHPARMNFGYVKIFSLFIMGYWVSRFLGFAHDKRRTVALERPAVLLFGLVLLFNVAVMIANNAGGALVSELVPEQRVLLALGLGAFILSLAMETYLVVWKVGAALGNPALTIRASVRTVHGNFWWSFGFIVAMMVPLMLAHYALNILAIGQPTWLVWTMLIGDSLLVGYLATVLMAANFIAARRACERKGVPLIADVAPAPAARAIAV